MFKRFKKKYFFLHQTKYRYIVKMCENEKQKLERGEGEEEEEKQARVQQDFLTLCAELNMDQVGLLFIYSVRCTA